MNCIWFQFTEISIQVIPPKDLCFIFRNGSPIWAGNKDQLIEILESIHEVPNTTLTKEQMRQQDDLSEQREEYD